MEEIRVKLIEKIKRADAVESFRFSPPKKINFLPGQFLQIMNKYLSMSSSPTKDYIEVTKKLSDSEFSNRLRNLKIDDEALVKIPMGDCVFKDEYKNIGFLTGGIGITPVISIIEYIIDKKLDTDVYLFYSNRTDTDIAFKKELDYWASVNKNIKIHYVVTGCQPKDKTCFFGIIDKGLLMKKVCDIKARTWFIYGPPAMVETMCNMSLELECRKENIKTERFIGY